MESIFLRILNTNHTPGAAITSEIKKNPGQPICSAITPLKGPTNTRPIEAMADNKAKWVALNCLLPELLNKCYPWGDTTGKRIAQLSFLQGECR